MAEVRGARRFSRRRMALIAGLSVLGLCVLCGIVIALLPDAPRQAAQGDATAPIVAIVSSPTAQATQGMPVSPVTPTVPPTQPMPTTAPTSAPTSIPTAAPTAQPTATPEPTETPTPTPSPEPTDTPEPTPTPEPTETPTPEPTPTPRPRPVVLEGSGQDVTRQFEAPSAVSRARFSYGGEGNFIVTAFGPEGTEDLLVNTIGSYNGTRPLFGEGEYFFEVEAEAPWTVRMEAVPMQRGAARGIEGRGDFVSGFFIPESESPEPWTFQNRGESNFVVYLHCVGGSELLQNEIGSVNNTGIVSFTEGPCLWEVQSEGRWSIGPR